MKKIIKSFATFNLALFLSLSALLSIAVPSAFAASVTWDGGGSDNNFSTAANWSGDTAPGSGDSIILPLDVLFSGCSSDVTLNNDLNDASVTLAGVSITGERPADCFYQLIVEGNTTKISGDFGTEGKDVYWNTNITATAPVTIANTLSSNDLAIGSNNVTVNESRFSGISGSGSLTITKPTSGGAGGGGGCSAQASPYPFTGNGSGFSGSLVVSGYAGMTVTSRTTDFARSASSITISGSDASLSFETDNQTNLNFDKNINLAGGYLNVSQSLDSDCNPLVSKSNVNLSGSVTFSGSTKVYLYGTNLNFSGTVSGENYIQLQEGQDGIITFANGSSLTSSMKVVTISDVANCSSSVYSAGSSVNTKLIVNVDCSAVAGIDANGPYQVGGILAGIGKMGHVKILKGGMISPGQSPGNLTVSSIVWEEGGTYEFEIGKDAADKIVTLGAVSLGNGTLTPALYNGYKPTAGKQYIIIDNDGTDAVTGTFKNLAEGATFKKDGYVYRISYVGGTGNDVVLTVVSVPSIPDTGLALIKSNPLATLIGATVAAGSIVYMSRRMKPAVKRSRR